MTVTTILLLYYYCITTVLLLYYYCITTVLPLYYYCITTVLLLYYYCITTVLLLYYYCITTVLPLYYYCITTVLLLYYYCITTVLLLYYYCITTIFTTMTQLWSKLVWTPRLSDHRRSYASFDKRLYTPSLPSLHSMLCFYYSSPKQDGNCVSVLENNGPFWHLPQPYYIKPVFHFHRIVVKRSVFYFVHIISYV